MKRADGKQLSAHKHSDQTSRHVSSLRSLVRTAKRSQQRRCQRQRKRPGMTRRRRESGSAGDATTRRPAVEKLTLQMSGLHGLASIYGLLFTAEELKGTAACWLEEGISEENPSQSSRMILKVSPSRVCLDEQTLQLDVLVERLHLWLQTADKRQSNRIRSTARPLPRSPSGALVKSFEFCDFADHYRWNILSFITFWKD